jgi:hypothetical protein
MSTKNNGNVIFFFYNQLSSYYLLNLNKAWIFFIFWGRIVKWQDEWAHYPKVLVRIQSPPR